MGFFNVLIHILKPLAKNIVPPILNAAGNAISNLDEDRPKRRLALDGYMFSRLDGKRMEVLGDDDMVDEGSTDLVNASRGLTKSEMETALLEAARVNVVLNQMPVTNFQETQVERHLSCSLMKTWMEPEEGKTVPDGFLRYYDHAYFDIIPAVVNNYHFNKLLDEFDYIALSAIIVRIEATSDVKTPTHLYYMPYSKETKMYVNADALRDVTEPSKYDAKNGEYVFNVNNPAFKRSVWTMGKTDKGAMTATVNITDIEPKVTMDRLISTEFLKSRFAGNSIYGVFPKDKLIAELKNKTDKNQTDADYMNGKTLEDYVLTYGRIFCTKDHLTAGEKSAVKVHIDLKFSCAKMVQSFAKIGRTSWTEDVTVTVSDGKYTVSSEVSAGSKIGTVPTNPDDANYDGNGQPNGEGGSSGGSGGDGSGGDGPGGDGDGGDGTQDNKSYIDPITPSTNYTHALRTSRRNFKAN